VKDAVLQVWPCGMQSGRIHHAYYWSIMPHNSTRTFLFASESQEERTAWMFQLRKRGAVTGQ
jgi:hypothetical protein